MKNYHSILGVSKDASAEEIKKAYKKLANKYHPDKPTGDHNKFIEIQEAYKALTEKPKQQPNDHFEYSFNGGNINIDDLIRQFHEQSGVFRRYKTIPVKLTLKEAFNGKTVILEGQNIVLPAGVRSYSKFRVNNNIYEVIVEHDEKYIVNGDDLYIKADISVLEAVVGLTVKLKHIDDKEYEIKIPKGVNHGTAIRVPEKGMPNPEFTNKKGHLYLVVSLFVPTNLTDEQLDAIINTGTRDQINL